MNSADLDNDDAAVLMCRIIARLHEQAVIRVSARLFGEIKSTLHRRRPFYLEIARLSYLGQLKPPTPGTPHADLSHLGRDENG